MRISDVAKEEDDLVNATSMRDLISSQSRKPHLRYELVNEDDNTNGADEASQEWPAKDIVQKAEPEDTCYQDECSSQACDDACDLGIPPSIVVSCCTLLDILAHYLSHQ
jgi:hypothetical protein